MNLCAAHSVQAQTAFIGGSIYAGVNDGSGPAYAPSPLVAPLPGATVMVQDQHSGGAHTGYATVDDNSWVLEVPCPGEYVVMFSVPGYDTTSRSFRLEDTSCGFKFKDAYLAPLPLPKANLLIYAFEDLYVNGEDDYPDDRGLEGVTFEVLDEDSNVVATGVSGTQGLWEIPRGAGPEMVGLHYFTGLEPGAYRVRAIAPQARLGTEGWLHTTSEEGSQMWDVVLRPGDPGTEAGTYLIWFGFVERLPASMGYDSPGIGTIRGTLLDAEGHDPAEPFPTDIPCVTPNDLVPNGFAVLYNDTRHPYVAATTLTDPVTGEYAFYDVPPGTYTVYAADIPLDYVWVPRQVELEPSATATNDILLPRFFSRVQGHVLDESGSALANARVVLRLGPGNAWKETLTDASGHYVFESLEEVETMGFLEVEAPLGMRAMTAPADPTEPDFCRAATGKRGNHYVMFYSGVNYQSDLYFEPIPRSVGDLRGFAFYDSLQPPNWIGDGIWQEDKEPTLKAVVLNLRNALTDEIVATTTTGEFDEYATMAQGWIRPFSTVPPDEFGGVFNGPVPGAYEFLDVAPGNYTLEVVRPAGFDMAPGGSERVAVAVLPGVGERIDFALTTRAPLAGIIEGGVFDDLNIDTNPLSTSYEEKAVITGSPVTVVDHLGYVLDSFVQPSPLCYESAPAGLCVRSDLGNKVEIERHVAPGSRAYLGNDPNHPAFNPNYLPMALNYELGQGTAKYEADWSLMPAAFAGLGGPMLAYWQILSGLPGENENERERERSILTRQSLADQSILAGNVIAAYQGLEGPMFTERRLLAANHPIIASPGGPVTVVPGELLQISGNNFGASRGYGTVSLSGEMLAITNWSDNSIEVEIPTTAVGGPLLVATSTGPSNAIVIDIDYSNDPARAAYLLERSVFVNASNGGAQDGSRLAPWSTITAALEHLPIALPRYVFIAPGTYNENVRIRESDVRIIGSGPLDTIVDGSGAGPMPPKQGLIGPGPVFFIGEDEFTGVENVLISGLMITRGAVNENVGAGIFAGHTNRNIDINNNMIARNGGYYGGGIWFHHSTHDVEIWSNSIAENGNFGGYGGGISVNDEPELEEGAKDDSKDDSKKDSKKGPKVGDDPGEGTPLGDGHPGTYNIFNNLIFHNQSVDYGGGISLYHMQDVLNLYGNMVIENRSDDHGGGAYFGHTGPMAIYGNIFLRNYCADDGGAISFEDTYNEAQPNKRFDIFNNLFAQNIADDRGENHARGGALAFDDSFNARVFNNTIVGNIVAGSYSPAGGGIDAERNSEDFDGSEGTYVAPGFSDPKIYNNIIWGNWRLNYDQVAHGDEEDLDYAWGANYRWSPDELHVDNPAVQGDWESYRNSQSFSFVRYNNIRGGYPGEGNIAVDPGFVDPDLLDWHLRPDSAVIDRAAAVVDAAQDCSAAANDFDGVVRPVSNGRVDIGAFEYLSGTQYALRIPTGILGAIAVPVPGTIALDCQGDCDDGNTCTTDICNPSMGCLHLANNGPCDDGNACTTLDSCTNGSCVGGPALDCDDDNSCTDDTCSPAHGCTNSANASICDDADACTTGDTCVSGTCVGGEPLDCSDDNICTLNLCVASTGCVSTVTSGSCDDGDACTSSDTCLAGTCVGGAVLECNDGDLCTDDTCDPEQGCVATLNSAPCDDGDICTGSDRCTAGYCRGVPLNCSDSNMCTTDVCDPVLGCTNIANTAPCSDSDPCTTDDYCSYGTCLGSTVDCSGLDNLCEAGACDSSTGGCITRPTTDCSPLDAPGVAGVCSPEDGTCEARSCASLLLSARASLPTADRELTLDLFIDGWQHGISAHTVNLTWNPEILVLVSVEAGSEPQFATKPSCIINTVAGKAVCTANAASPPPYPGGPVHVATARMSVKADADAATVTVAAQMLSSATGESLVPCAPAVPLELHRAPGDVNGDGTVGIVDALFSAQYTVGIRGCGDFPNYDMCDIHPAIPDGVCSIADALWMGQCSVGLIPCEFDRGVLSCDDIALAAIQARTPASAAAYQRPGLATVGTSPLRAVAKTGNIVTAEVVVDSDSPLGAYDVEIRCDGSAFEIISPIRGGGSAEFSATPMQIVSGCDAKIAGFQVSDMDGPVGSVSIAKVDLRVLDVSAAGLPNPVRIVSSELSDTQGQPLKALDGPCGNGARGDETAGSARMKTNLKKNPGDKVIRLAAAFALAELGVMPDESGMRLSLTNDRGLLLYVADIPASGFVLADGRKKIFKTKDTTATVAEGLLHASVKLIPKKSVVKVRARIAAPSAGAVSDQSALKVALLFASGADGECLVGSAMACKDRAGRLRCHQTRTSRR